MPDPTLLPPIQTTASFLPQADLTHEAQQEKRETTVTVDADHVDHIEEEDMDIDSSASEDESHPAKVARTDTIPAADQEVVHMNGPLPLVGINTASSQGNGGQIIESVGQPMSGNEMPANALNRPSIEGMNVLPFHPPQRTNPTASENHLPNPAPHPAILQTPTTPPLFSPSLLLRPPFIHPMAQNFHMPMTAPTQTVQPGSVVNPMMVRLPPNYPPQTFNRPQYPNNQRFPGRIRGRGRGAHQTQPVPSRFY